MALAAAEAQGSVATRHTNDALRRVQLVNKEEALRVAMTYRPGTTLVVTELPASPDTRTGPDFVVAEGEAYRMPRRKRKTGQSKSANTGTAGERAGST